MELSTMKGSEMTASGMRPDDSKRPGIMESLFIGNIKGRLANCQGRLLLGFPSGYQQTFGSGEPQVSVQLHSLKPLLRLFTGGTNGWSDAYLCGEWDSPDLTALVRWALRNEAELSGISKAQWFNDMLYNLYHWQHRNTRRGSRRNIATHYDLGNRFYQKWLDPGMTYSSALFLDPDMTLQQAQTAKYQRILALLSPREGSRILEIGCGWGEFALQALQQHPVEIDGVTLSVEQRQWAQEKLIQAGFAEHANVSLTDYRDIKRQYDNVVSIEMFEAVGQEHWDTYFTKLKGVLKPGGKAVLQIITIDDVRFEHYSRQAEFIQRHVFPGGMLPSVKVLKEKFSQHGFRLAHQQMFGKDYARTLFCWHTQFEQHWSQISEQGFDENFRRLWRYYLSYCEGGFEENAIDVGLFVLEHESH